MAKKILSEEMIVDSDDGLSESSDAEREFEEKAISFQPPRKYTKKTDLKKPNSSTVKSSKIFLFKFPKELDVSKLNSIPLTGSGELKIDDKLYNISEESENKAIKEKFKIFLPNGDSSLKNEKELKVSRFFDISEKVIIPEINYSKVVIPRTDVEKEEGLRMRHFPTGYYINDFEEAQQPVIPGPDSKKRSLTTEEDSPAKKSKKDKKDKKDKKEKKEKKEKKSKK